MPFCLCLNAIKWKLAPRTASHNCANVCSVLNSSSHLGRSNRRLEVKFGIWLNEPDCSTFHLLLSESSELVVTTIVTQWLHRYYWFMNLIYKSQIIQRIQTTPLKESSTPSESNKFYYEISLRQCARVRCRIRIWYCRTSECWFVKVKEIQALTMSL